MPDAIDYNPLRERLFVGTGWIEPVSPATWGYEVSGKHVLTQWFSSRRKTRERPIGDRRPPSPLGDIQPDVWPAEYTTELIDLLNVLGRLTDLEPKQAQSLDTICAGPLISVTCLRDASVFFDVSHGAGQNFSAGSQADFISDAPSDD